MFKWIFAGCAYLAAVVLVSVHFLPIKKANNTTDEARSTALTAENVTSWRRERGSPPPRQATRRVADASNESAQPHTAARSGKAATVSVASARMEPTNQRWTFRIIDADPAIPSNAGTSDNNYALTRRIQREINRVGCANLTVTGAWNRRTRSAMAAFAANRNATLPTNKPDVILLSLLRTYQGTDCGRTVSTHVAHQTDRPSLHTAPRLVRQVQRPTVISGWTTQINSTAPLAGRGTVAARTQQTTSYAATAPSNYRPGPAGRLNENRMALGVRPGYGAPGTPPPVTVQPPGYHYSSEFAADEEARRLDAARAAALQRANASKKRQRNTRRRAYRRRENWKTRAFATQN